ncbi:MAG TPA: LCP family protein [Actinomycetes bacterium]
MWSTRFAAPNSAGGRRPPDATPSRWPGWPLSRAPRSPPGRPWRSFDIRPGRQHLDGPAALAYARSRYGTSDYDRMRRQRCLLSALAGQAGPAAMPRALPGLAPKVQRSVSTDIPDGSCPR